MPLLPDLAILIPRPSMFNRHHLLPHPTSSSYKNQGSPAFQRMIGDPDPGKRLCLHHVTMTISIPTTTTTMVPVKPVTADLWAGLESAAWHKGIPLPSSRPTSNSRCVGPGPAVVRLLFFLTQSWLLLLIHLMFLTPSQVFRLVTLWQMLKAAHNANSSYTSVKLFNKQRKFLFPAPLAPHPDLPQKQAHGCILSLQYKSHIRGRRVSAWPFAVKNKQQTWTCPCSLFQMSIIPLSPWVRCLGPQQLWLCSDMWCCSPFLSHSPLLPTCPQLQPQPFFVRSAASMSSLQQYPWQLLNCYTHLYYSLAIIFQTLSGYLLALGLCLY